MLGFLQDTPGTEKQARGLPERPGTRQGRGGAQNSGSEENCRPASRSAPVWSGRLQRWAQAGVRGWGQGQGLRNCPENSPGEGGESQSEHFQ